MRHRTTRPDLLLLFCNTLLLFCTLSGSFLSFLGLYAESGYETRTMPQGLVLFSEKYGNGKLMLFCLCLAVFFGLLYSLRHGSKILLILASILCFVSVCVHRKLYTGILLTCELIADLFESLVDSSIPAVDFRLMLPSEEQLAATELFLCLALILAAFLLGWAIIRARRWWLVVLLTLLPLLPGLVASIYPNWTYFLMLCAAWCTMLITSLCRKAAPSARAKLTLTTLPATAVLLALTFLVFPVDQYERPQWAYTAETWLVNFTNREFSFLSEWEGPFSGVDLATYVGSAERVNLSAAGPLEYTERTVLRVTSKDYTGKTYLRGSSLARYTGESWEPLEDGVYELYLEEIEPYDLDFSNSPLILPAYTLSSNKTCTLTVQNIGASGSCVYVPYQLTDQDWAYAGLLVVEDSYLAHRSGQWTHIVSFRPLNETFADTLYSRQKAANAQKAYYETVSEYYTGDTSALPQSVLDDFRRYEQAQTTSTSTFSELDYAELVADFLADRCVYDQNTPLTPAGEDFVAYFLTQSKQGYCMHFASAAVLLLRELGYPARYVSGFTADVVAERTTNVPDSAAHAWVEIYVVGYGWYPVEVTPASAYRNEQTAPAPIESEPPEEETPPETHPPEPSPSESPTVTPPIGTSTNEPAANEFPEKSDTSIQLLYACLRALGWLALTAIVLLLLWLGQYLLKKLRTKNMTSQNTNQAVLHCYRYLSHLERWGGHIDGNATELAQKARFSQHTLSEEERQIMISLFDSTRIKITTGLSTVPLLLFQYFWGIPAQQKSPRSKQTNL